MRPAVGPDWLVWLETSAIAAAMRQWTWLYPVVEIADILGFVVLVGAAAMFGVRLLGASRPVPVTSLERHLLPWARASLFVIVPSGALMFVAHATEMATNPAFRLKLVLVAAARLNAAVFRRVPFKSVARWDAHGPRPRRPGPPPCSRSCSGRG